MLDRREMVPYARDCSGNSAIEQYLHWLATHLYAPGNVVGNPATFIWLFVASMPTRGIVLSSDTDVKACQAGETGWRIHKKDRSKKALCCKTSNGYLTLVELPLSAQERT